MENTGQNKLQLNVDISEVVYVLFLTKIQRIHAPTHATQFAKPFGYSSYQVWFIIDTPGNINKLKIEEQIMIKTNYGQYYQIYKNCAKDSFF